MAQRKKSTASRNLKVSQAIATTLRLILSPLGHFRRDTMLSILAETIIPIVNVQTVHDKTIKFWGFGGWPLYRGRSVLEKEKLTISWIDGFEPDSVFWDIGANIGAFSIYAAAARKIETYSFEPSASNYAVLCRNIEINKADETVTSFPIALSNKTEAGHLNMISTSAGNTGGQFIEAEERESNIFKQSCLGFTANDFVKAYKIPMPNHIKIDVDGIEILILQGADDILKNKALKSLILEADITTQEYKDITALLLTYGFAEKESEPTVKGRGHMRNFVFAR